MQRKTYVEIDGDLLKKNVKEIIQKYPSYDYYFGVVKNNAYHHGIKTVLDMVEGGINYFAVSSLEEALQLRRYLLDYPILCLEPIDLNFIDDVLNANITITVESVEYLKSLVELDLYTDLKVHLAVDSGMHRIGLETKEDFNSSVQFIQKHPRLILEGVYSHFATSGIMDPFWDLQVNKFLEITKDVDLTKIPIVHFGRSLTLVNHEKLPFCNGIRLGICMYGFSQSMKGSRGLKGSLRNIKRKYYQKKYHCSLTYLENDLQLDPVMSFYTEVMSVRKVAKKERIGYNTYECREDGYILTLPVGYADGVTKNYKYVFLDGQKLPIVSDSMDMIMVFSSTYYPVGKRVELFGKNISIRQVCASMGMNAYHLFNMISNRVPRVHIHNGEKEEVYY